MDRLAALLNYLWTYVIVRLGPLWRGAAATAGVVAAAGFVFVARERDGSVRPGRALAAGLLAAYVVAVVAGTVAARPRASARVLHLDVLGRLWRLFVQGHALEPEPLANMLMLAPVGLLLPAALGLRLRGTLLSSLALSAGVEAAQYLLVRGDCEPADVVLNMAGALVGYGVWLVARRLFRLASCRVRRVRDVGF